LFISCGQTSVNETSNLNETDEGESIFAEANSIETYETLKTREPTIPLRVSLTLDGHSPTSFLSLDGSAESGSVASYKVRVKGCISRNEQSADVSPSIPHIYGSGENDLQISSGLIKLIRGDSGCKTIIDSLNFCSDSSDSDSCRDYSAESSALADWELGDRIKFSTSDQTRNIYFTIVSQIDDVISGDQSVVFNVSTVDQGSQIVVSSDYYSHGASISEESNIYLSVADKSVHIGPTGRGIFDFTFYCTDGMVEILDDGARYMCGQDDMKSLKVNLVNADINGTGDETAFFETIKDNIDKCLDYVALADGNRGRLLRPFGADEIGYANSVDVSDGGATVQVRGYKEPLGGQASGQTSSAESYNAVDYVLVMGSLSSKKCKAWPLRVSLPRDSFSAE